MFYFPLPVFVCFPAFSSCSSVIHELKLQLIIIIVFGQKNE